MSKGKSKNEQKQDKAVVDELRNQLARALADYDNLSKRVNRERDEMQNNAALRLVLRLLPILDMLEAAQKHLADPGLAITVKEFSDLLNQEGFEEIKTKVGESFDENLHEAIEVLETKAQNEDNTIAEVLQTGWKVREGQVVRPVKVKVAKTVSSKAEK